MIAKKVPVTVHTYDITQIDETEITIILTALRRMMQRESSARMSVPTQGDRMKAAELFTKLDEMHRSAVPRDLFEGPDDEEDED